MHAATMTTGAVKINRYSIISRTIFIVFKKFSNIVSLLNMLSMVIKRSYMAETFYILNNFPDDLKKELETEFSSKTEGPMQPGLKQYYLPTDNRLMKLFPKSWQIGYLGIPKNKLVPAHLDRKRLCAINVPIRVDFKNSFFVCGNHLWLGRYKQSDTRYPYSTDIGIGPEGFYEVDSENYSTYNLEKPVVFSTKVPHGGDNVNGDFDRIICTIGYRDLSYEQLLNEIPSEWF